MHGWGCMPLHVRALPEDNWSTHVKVLDLLNRSFGQLGLCTEASNLPSLLCTELSFLQRGSRLLCFTAPNFRRRLGWDDPSGIIGRQSHKVVTVGEANGIATVEPTMFGLS